MCLKTSFLNFKISLVLFLGSSHISGEFFFNYCHLWVTRLYLFGCIKLLFSLRLSFEPGNWSIQSFWRHLIRGFWGPGCQRELPSSLPDCYYQPRGVLWCQRCGFPEEHHGQALSGRTRGIHCDFYKIFPIFLSKKYQLFPYGI